MKIRTKDNGHHGRNLARDTIDDVVSEKRSERKGELEKGEKRLMRTTKGGPHGQVQRARNFISESGRPCIFHAARKRHDASPIDNHAIYSCTIHGHAARHGARAKGKKTTTRASVTLRTQ